MLSSHFLTRVPTPDNGPGAASTTLPMAERTRLYSGFRWIEVRYFDIAPTFSTAELAAEGVHEARWFTLDELAGETTGPRRLLELVRDVLDKGPPPEPVDVGR